MEPFTRLVAVAAPLVRDNVDTDAIIPSREMRTVGKTGLAEGLFAGWRYTAIGGRDSDPAFVLNRPEYRGARILLAGANFGCGSSREHAAWALAEYGFRAILAPSFNPIFHGNCVRNGIAPVVLPADAVAALAAEVAPDPQATRLTVDLEAQRVTSPLGSDYAFAIAEEAKAMLVGGLDAIDLTLTRRAAIDAFVAADRGPARVGLCVGRTRGMSARRAFADLPHGQVHYRHAGADGPPVLLLHAGPGSSRQIEPLVAALAPTFRAIAPDMPGNGDSVALPIASPDIADYAAALVLLLDRLGLERVDVYGSHVGAAIAAELAIRAPARVGRIVLDGVGVFAPAQRDELLACYARPFVPDLDGAYLIRAFHFLRDQYLFFPWYDRTAAAWRGAGLRSADELHAWLVEVLKAPETYVRAYRAAFSWSARERLPLVRCPVLMTAAADDPLHDGTRDASSLLRDGSFTALPRFGDPDFTVARTRLIVEAFS